LYLLPLHKNSNGSRLDSKHIDSHSVFTRRSNGRYEKLEPIPWE